MLRWLLAVAAFLLVSLPSYGEFARSRIYWRSQGESYQNHPGGYQSQQNDRAQSGSNIYGQGGRVNANHGYNVESRYRVTSPEGAPLAQGRITYQGQSESVGRSYDAAVAMPEPTNNARNF